MKTIKKNYGIALVLACNLAASIEAQNIYVANDDNGIIGEYGLDGSTINASLISGLRNPNGITILGDNLFVANQNPGTIGEYTTSGAMVNASLIMGLGNTGYIALGPVPEPSAGALTGLGAVALCLWRLRK